MPDSLSDVAFHFNYRLIILSFNDNSLGLLLKVERMYVNIYMHFSVLFLFYLIAYYQSEIHMYLNTETLRN